MPTKFTYKFTIKVRKSHLDNLNHVNNVKYLDWVQLAAKKHWHYLSKSLDSSSYMWVVSRHEIDYFKSAVLNDVVEIRTYIGESGGFKSLRYVEMKVGNHLIAKAKTTWALLDTNTLKPKRISGEMEKILLENQIKDAISASDS